MAKDWTVTVDYKEKEVIIESQVFDVVIIASIDEAANMLLELAQAFHILGWLENSGELSVKVGQDDGKA